jgi:hypothetical protein
VTRITPFTHAGRRGCLPACACALGLLATVPAVHARTPFQDRCDAEAAGAVATVTSQDHGWRIDNSLSFRTLTAMKRPRVTNGWVLGLTHTESRITVKVDGKQFEDAAGGYECVLPRVDVGLDYVPIVVYVGREFAPGTCAYREVLAHEMRHLKSYQAMLPTVGETVRAKLANRYAGKPLFARTGQARGMLQNEIDAVWLPYVRNEMARIERLQLEIDTPQEYARLSKVCHGEVQSLIASTRRTP